MASEIFTCFSYLNQNQILYKEKFLHEDIFANLAQTDILQVFIFAIVQRELHIVEPIGPMSKLTIVAINHRHIFQHKKFIRNVMKAGFCTTLTCREYITSLND